MHVGGKRSHSRCVQEKKVAQYSKFQHETLNKQGKDNLSFPALLLSQRLTRKEKEKKKISPFLSS